MDCVPQELIQTILRFANNGILAGKCALASKWWKRHIDGSQGLWAELALDRGFSALVQDSYLSPNSNQASPTSWQRFYQYCSESVSNALSGKCSVNVAMAPSLDIFRSTRQLRTQFVGLTGLVQAQRTLARSYMDIDLELYLVNLHTQTIKPFQPDGAFEFTRSRIVSEDRLIVLGSDGTAKNICDSTKSLNLELPPNHELMDFPPHDKSAGLGYLLLYALEIGTVKSQWLMVSTNLDKSSLLLEKLNNVDVLAVGSLFLRQVDDRITFHRLDEKQLQATLEKVFVPKLDLITWRMSEVLQHYICFTARQQWNCGLAMRIVASDGPKEGETVAQIPRLSAACTASTSELLFVGFQSYIYVYAPPEFKQTHRYNVRGGEIARLQALDSTRLLVTTSTGLLELNFAPIKNKWQKVNVVVALPQSLPGDEAVSFTEQCLFASDLLGFVEQVLECPGRKFINSCRLAEKDSARYIMFWNTRPEDRTPNKLGELRQSLAPVYIGYDYEVPNPDESDLDPFHGLFQHDVHRILGPVVVTKEIRSTQPAAVDLPWRHWTLDTLTKEELSTLLASLDRTVRQ